MKSKLKILSCLASLVICVSAVSTTFAMSARNEDDAIIFRPERAFLMTRFGAGMRRYENTEIPTPPIFFATERNNFREITRELTINPAAVNLVDAYEVTPIYIAISQQAEEIVDYLVNHGADLTVTDRFGNTPLHKAVETENFNLVRIILRSGRASINALNNREETPLTLAVRHNQGPVRQDEAEQITQYLINHGAVNPLEGAEEQQPTRVIRAHAPDLNWWLMGNLPHNN